MLTVVSYATEGVYAVEIERLKASCAKFGVPLIYEIVRPRANWRLNCGMKPEFLQRMLLEHPGKTLLWLDADAEVRGPLVALEHIDCDIGVRWRKWPDRTELLSGTILLKPTDKTLELVTRWVRMQQAEPETWDQKVLAKAVLETPGIRTHDLDPRWCFIFDEPSPVAIVHHQASRKHRRAMSMPMRIGVRR